MTSGDVTVTDFVVMWRHVTAYFFLICWFRSCWFRISRFNVHPTYNFFRNPRKTRIFRKIQMFFIFFETMMISRFSRSLLKIWRPKNLCLYFVLLKKIFFQYNLLKTLVKNLILFSLYCTSTEKTLSTYSSLLRLCFCRFNINVSNRFLKSISSLLYSECVQKEVNYVFIS